MQNWRSITKVALFDDHCPAYSLEELRNSDLIFLSPDTTSVLQLLDQTLITVLGGCSLSAIIRRSAVVNTTFPKLNVPAALRALMSWAKLSPQHAACFKYAGVFKRDGVSSDITDLDKL
jgi:hypothetical protein